MTSTLSATGLSKHYRQRAVVDGLSLEIHSGEVVGLLGPNGAGKTTAFYMIVGLVPCDDGAVRIDGEDVTHLPMHVRARRGIGYLPQEASVFRKLSVADNVMAILETLPGVDRAARRRFPGRQRLQRQRVDLPAHRIAQRRVHQLVTLQRALPVEQGRDHHGLEVHVVVGAYERAGARQAVLDVLANLVGGHFGLTKRGCRDLTASGRGEATAPWPVHPRRDPPGHRQVWAVYHRDNSAAIRPGP